MKISLKHKINFFLNKQETKLKRLTLSSYPVVLSIVPSMRCNKSRDVKELLILAREKEKASFGFYNDMSKHLFVNDDIRNLLNELRDAESGHIQK